MPDDYNIYITPAINPSVSTLKSWTSSTQKVICIPEFIYTKASYFDLLHIRLPVCSLAAVTDSVVYSPRCIFCNKCVLGAPAIYIYSSASRSISFCLSSSLTNEQVTVSRKGGDAQRQRKGCGLRPAGGVPGTNQKRNVRRGKVRVQPGA